jgi:putative protease
VDGLELELFVHGAMCMAISGRCLLSAHLNERSANLGLCTHPCRFDYKTVAIRVDEQTRPGEGLWEITQDKEYSQILSAQDLCLIKYLPWFVKNRITSLKIEGRMKTSAYLCRVVDTYRTGLNDLAAKNFRPHLYLDHLFRTATRPLSSGFFCPRRRIFFTPEAQPEKTVLARIIRQINTDSWEIAVKNQWDTTHPVAVLAPGLKRPVLSPNLFRVEKETGEAVTTANPGLNYVLRADHPDLAPHLFLEQCPSDRAKN